MLLLWVNNMDVSEILERETIDEFLSDQIRVEVSGWLVVIHSELYVLEKDFQEPFHSGKKIRISNRDIALSVREKVQPLGGGESFIFYPTTIYGILSGNRSSPILTPVELDVNDRGGNESVFVSLSPADMEGAKEKYGGLLYSVTKIQEIG
jgi:hypothetical protein